MQTKFSLKLTLVAPALVTLVLVGCGGGGDGKNAGGPTGAASTGGGTKAPGESGPVEGKGTATIKGKIVYDGEAPKPDDLSKQIGEQQDKDTCLKDDPKNPNPTHARNWVVGKDGGVEFAAVWIRAPQGKWFTFTDEQKKSWPTEVLVDQPFCHFEPHVSTAFVSFKDGKKTVETGQKVVIKNDAKITHNTKYAGDKREVPGENLTLKAGDKVDLKVASNMQTPVTLNCDIHKWMAGYVWVLDTPYAAVTKPDGTFEIKGVPAGTKLNLVVWHEGTGFGEGGERGKVIEIKEGDNDLGTIKIKSK
jgi:hypothetical protein